MGKEKEILIVLRLTAAPIQKLYMVVGFSDEGLE
jgi:hypothetical protein